MNFSDTEEENAFREQLREFLTQNSPAVVDDSFECQLNWQRTLYDYGWAAPHWPAAFGGRECSVTEFAIYIEEMGRVHTPQMAGRVGINMVGSTILAHGSEDAKKRYLRPMLAGDEIWCQMLSEPDSGSDLKSVSTRARLSDGRWVVSGQKVWSSSAFEADLGLLFARTGEPDDQGSFTCLICDMAASGVEVRPLRQMTGDTEFCEVFLVDVEIPFDAVIGPVGAGWEVLTTTLSNERGLSYPMKEQIFLHRQLDSLLDAYRKGKIRPSSILRQRLVDRVIADQIFKLLNLRTLSRLAEGEEPGPLASITKLAFSDHAQALQDVMVDCVGLDGIAGTEEAWRSFLWYREASISGGTSEVQRNILAESVLGLPRERRWAPP